MATATAFRSASDIAHLFAQRLRPDGGWVSAKQARWLKNVADTEMRRDDRNFRSERHAAFGIFCQPCGSEWRLSIMGNGAGSLQIETCRHTEGGAA